MQIVVTLFIVILISCGFAGGSSDSSASTNTSNTLFTSDDNTSTYKKADIDTSVSVDDSASLLSIENLLLTIQCNHPNSDDRNIFYFLCVQGDGSIYSLDYSIIKDGVYNYDFPKKLYSCDNSAWDYAENIELIGELSQNDIDLLMKNICQIDVTSEYYDRQRDDMGLAPDVEESINYNVYAYPLMKSGGKKAFHIESSGERQGNSYRTYDENALAVLDLIKSTQFFDDWQQECNAISN